MGLDINSLNQKTKKGKVATFVVVGFLVVITLSIFTYVFFNTSANNRAAKIFEDAFIQILEFNDQKNIYSKQEMEGDIIYILDEVISQYSNTSSGIRAVFYKAYIYYNVEKYEEAIKVFNYFIKKYNKNSLTEKAYYYLSYCYSETGKVEEAIEILKDLEKNYPKSYYTFVVQYRLGFLYENIDKEQSIAYYKKIIENKDTGSQKEKAKKRLAIIQNTVIFE